MTDREHDLDPRQLRGLGILWGVDLDAVRGLLDDCPVRDLGEGDVLLEKGRTNSRMFMILTGSLGVRLEDRHAASVATLGPGQVVGELSVIDGHPVSAHVVAERETRVLEVDEEAFWCLVEASHDFAANLLVLLARRMRENNFALAESSERSRRFEREALFDGLTGLHNRRWLDDRLPRLVARHQRDGRPMSLLMLDVDHFKRFNDTWGHAAGDRVLVSVAAVLSSRLRPTDLAARHGGEEFVVVLPGTDESGARVAAERVRNLVGAAEVRTGDGTVLPRVTVSIGVAELGDGAAPDLLERADRALYRAKDRGRNRVET